MRQTFDKETVTREKVNQFIKEKATQTAKIVYLTPTRVQTLLQARGIIVSKDYVFRRYEELGIKNVNGLWVKELQ